MTMTRKYLQKTLTAFMVVWLSGAVFLVLCHAKPMEMADSCPLIKMGAHCDKADKQQTSESVEQPSTDQSIDCCAFIPTFFDKTRSSNTGSVVAVVPATIAPNYRPNIKTVRTPQPFVRISTLVLQKNDTFLKNRTFRI